MSSQYLNMVRREVESTLRAPKLGYLMQLYASRNIHSLYIYIYIYIFAFLVRRATRGPTSKQITSLEIGLKCIRSDYNHGHIIRELRTRVRFSLWNWSLCNGWGSHLQYLEKHVTPKNTYARLIVWFIWGGGLGYKSRLHIDFSKY